MDSVLALVLTYDARTALEECLRSISAQTTPVNEILVIDNASPEPVDDIVSAFPAARLLRSPENDGPAGGYAKGLAEFRKSHHAWVWIMDDDCRPELEALSRMREFSRNRNGDHPGVTLADVRTADTGDRLSGIGWWGALIPHEIVEAVGVPNSELFWWTEDTEYLQWRIPEAGYPVDICPGALVHVNRTRANAEKPAWKYYYEARNQVHHRLRVQRTDRRPMPRHLKVRVRAWRAIRSVSKLASRAAFVDRTDRGVKLSMVGRGAIDGLRGRLGKTVAADSADRPRSAHPTDQLP